MMDAFRAHVAITRLSAEQVDRLCDLVTSRYPKTSRLSDASLVGATLFAYQVKEWGGSDYFLSHLYLARGEIVQGSGERVPKEDIWLKLPGNAGPLRKVFYGFVFPVY